MLTIILIGVGVVFAFLIWMLKIEGKETPEQIEQRMENNLKELWRNSNAPLLKFKSHEEAEQFFELVAKDGSIHALPPVYREQAENYLKTRPLTIAQARAELKKECSDIYNRKYRASLGTPTRCIGEWERWEEREKLSITDTAQYERLIKLGIHESWVRVPEDEDFIYCVIDIVIQDEFPDIAKLYKYIGRLSDNGIEKLMDIIGNKLERLNG